VVKRLDIDFRRDLKNNPRYTQYTIHILKQFMEILEKLEITTQNVYKNYDTTEMLQYVRQ
jgi:hypothetical protein